MASLISHRWHVFLQVFAPDPIQKLPFEGHALDHSGAQDPADLHLGHPHTPSSQQQPGHLRKCSSSPVGQQSLAPSRQTSSGHAVHAPIPDMQGPRASPPGTPMAQQDRESEQAIDSCPVTPSGPTIPLPATAEELLSPGASPQVSKAHESLMLVFLQLLCLIQQPAPGQPLVLPAASGWITA